MVSESQLAIFGEDTHRCRYCGGDGYVETECAIGFPTCRVCKGSGRVADPGFHARKSA